MGGGTNLFLGVKAGATNKKTDIEGLSRITEVANPAISTDGNAIFQSCKIWGKALLHEYFAHCKL